jgi:predicted NBD/HSP70 family sugar kinase
VEPRDQTDLRRANLALVLTALRTRGPHSRAGLARLTGLNKATTSSLVTELGHRGLVRLGDPAPGQFGRPGALVELDPGRVCAIGLEANVDYAAVAVLDLAGDLLRHHRVACDLVALGPTGALDVLAKLAAREIAEAEARGRWVAGVGVAVPGLIDVADGVVKLAPNLGWRDVPVAAELTERIGVTPGVDNDANFSAVAEHAVSGTSELLYLTGEIGVGGGVISGGSLLRGATGFTGEVGHMPLDPAGQRCGCGRVGCWETSVGLGALLRAVGDADDPVRDAALDLESRLEVIRERAASGDERTLAALRGIGTALGVGASILINVLNPAAVVLGGYFAVLGQWLLDPARDEISARVLAPDSGGCELVLSDLGFTAAVRGGAHAALAEVFADPTVVPENRNTS